MAGYAACARYGTERPTAFVLLAHKPEGILPTHQWLVRGRRQRLGRRSFVDSDPPSECKWSACLLVWEFSDDEHPEPLQSLSNLSVWVCFA